MSILARIRRVVQANMHDLLDKVDTPEMEIESRVDELHRALGEARRALAGYAVTRKRLASDRESLERKQEDLQTRAEEALRAGNEALARDCLAERVRVEQRLEQVIPAAEKSAATFTEMKDNLVALGEQLKMARAKLAELRARKRSAEARQAAGEKLEQARHAAAEAVGFDRLEEQVSEAETDIEIQEEIQAELGDIEDKLEAGDTESRIDHELSQLKRKVGSN